MLRSLKHLERYTLSASDGDSGKVIDFLFDDASWTIRYLVADTGGVLDGRSVLVSPSSFRDVDTTARKLHLALTRDKIRCSPSVDTHKPVSRQHERDVLCYYGYPYYWGGPALWDMSGGSTWLGVPSGAGDPQAFAEAPDDPHLRSEHEVRGYHVRGTDQTIGHVDDFLVDWETWEIRYLVVDTSNWWMGKKVLVSPRWATRVSWEERMLDVSMSRGRIEKSPTWSGVDMVDHGYEERLHRHYEQPFANEPRPRT